MKRTLALLLALLMLLTCTAVTALADDGKLKIYWLGYYTSDYMIANDTWGEKVLEEYFPDVDIIPITDVNSANKGVYVATGECLESTVMFSQFINGNPYDLLDQEVLRTFPAEWLDEYFPDGMAAIRDTLGDAYIEDGNLLWNGQAYNVPFASAQSFAPWINLIRQDWLDNLNLKMPATIDELHDVLYAFTYNDPDGNGINDTYGYDPIRNECGPALIWGAFGIQSHMNKGSTFMLQADGTVTYTGVSEEYRQALTLLKQWYDEGIIDPECITDMRASVRSKWTAGKVGVLSDVWSWSMSSRGTQGIVGMVEAVAGEGTVKAMTPLTCDTGDGNVWMAYTNTPSTNGNAYYFTASATDEQVIAFLQIANELVKNDELWLKMYYGEEGIDYNMVDGKVVVTDLGGKLEHQVEKGIYTYFGSASIPASRLALTLSDDDVERLDICKQWKLTYSGQNFGSVACEAYDTYFSEMRKVEDEYYANVLLGNASLDDWDAHVAMMYQAGLDKILAGYEAALK